MKPTSKLKYFPIKWQFKFESSLAICFLQKQRRKEISRYLGHEGKGCDLSDLNLFFFHKVSFITLKRRCVKILKFKYKIDWFHLLSFITERIKNEKDNIWSL